MQEANQKLFEVSRAKKQNLQAAILPKIGKEHEATSGKLPEIHDSASKRITCVEERVSHFVDTKVVNWKIVDRKLVIMEERINNFQSQRREPARVVSEETARLKPLYFNSKQ